MIAKNFWPGILWGVIIVILSAMPGNYFPKVQTFSTWLGPDKIVHIFLYFVFCFLIQKGIVKHYHLNNKLLLTGMLIVVLFGGAMEIMQYYFFTGRNGNVFDFLANIFGCTLSYVLILYMERKKSHKSH